MTTAVYRQNSFAGGMMSRTLEGRTDFPKRLTGARQITNFLVTPQGTLRKRAGVQNIEGVVLPPGAVSMTTFVHEGVERFLVVLASNILRVWDTAQSPVEEVVISPMAAGGGTSTPWSTREGGTGDAELSAVRWTQAVGTMLFTHEDHEPRVLSYEKRAGDAVPVWRFELASAYAGPKSPALRVETL